MPEAAAIQTVLGFDFGTRKFGVATGQRITATASPLPPIPSRDGIPDWTVVDSLLAEWRPQALLVGGGGALLGVQPGQDGAGVGAHALLYARPGAAGRR